MQASPDGSTTTNIETKELGGGTLTSGVRESSGAKSELAQSVKLRVTSFRHLDERCAIARMPQPNR